MTESPKTETWDAEQWRRTSRRWLFAGGVSLGFAWGLGVGTLLAGGWWIQLTVVAGGTILYILYYKLLTRHFERKRQAAS